MGRKKRELTRIDFNMLTDDVNDLDLYAELFHNGNRTNALIYLIKTSLKEIPQLRK